MTFTRRELELILQALAYGSVEHIYEQQGHRVARVLMNRIRKEIAGLKDPLKTDG